MAIELAEPAKVKVGYKEQFMERMRLLSQKTKGIQGKYMPAENGAKPYFKWRFMANWIIIRCYDDKLTIHAWGDIDAYQCKEVKYNEVSYETNDLDFVSRLLDTKPDGK